MIPEIRFYRAVGKYGFLSNLYKHPIVFEGKEFTCSETAYQFGKPRDLAVAEWIVSAPKPQLSAAAAHALFAFDIRPDWNQIKVERMRDVLKVKFQSEGLAFFLANTGISPLIEESKTDAFWGIGKKGNGKNMLGNLLTEIRADIFKWDSHFNSCPLWNDGEGMCTHPDHPGGYCGESECPRAKHEVSR